MVSRWYRLKKATTLGLPATNLTRGVASTELRCSGGLVHMHPDPLTLSSDLVNVKPVAVAALCFVANDMGCDF